MKNGPNWVVVVVVGAALLAPLLDEAIALRFIADFFALGLGMALAVGAARTLRGTSSQTAQQDPPVEIATLTPGLPGVIAGKVITPAEEPSRLTDDVFVAVLGSVVRVEGNVGAQHTPIRTRLRGETLEVRDASGAD
ncbi:MAG: hypothetical protein KC619_17560, partial [Myxococcales bacterium]|nr:hypothetical protein [Myxococcales bacterium]